MRNYYRLHPIRRCRIPGDFPLWETPARTDSRAEVILPTDQLAAESAKPPVNPPDTQPVSLGRRRLWSVSELQRWIDAGAPSADRWAIIVGNRIRARVSGDQDAEYQAIQTKAGVGFEPTNRGFAIRSLSPLGHPAGWWKNNNRIIGASRQLRGSRVAKMWRRLAVSGMVS